MEEDAANPAKMFVAQPMRIMEQCKYVTTGTFTGAAISESGELYTWGFNIFGQCGAPVTKDDFIRVPEKVMDGVKMAWPDRIAFDDSLNQSPEYGIRETSYLYNTFALKEDGSLLAVGLHTGNKEKVTELNGDIVETQIHQYGDAFVPVQVTEYAADNYLTILGRLEFGTSIDEVEEMLNSAGMRTFRTEGEGVSSEGYAVCLSAQYNQYHCYFDNQDKLARISIQEGGSRDGQFALGMSLSDLEKAVEEMGGFLTKEENDRPFDIWLYQNQELQIQYEFSVYDGKVTVVDEFP